MITNRILEKWRSLLSTPFLSKKETSSLERWKKSSLLVSPKESSLGGSSLADFLHLNDTMKRRALELPYHYVQKRGVLPFKEDKETIVFLCRELPPSDVYQEMKMRFLKEPLFEVVEKEVLEELIHSLFEKRERSTSDILQGVEKDKGILEGENAVYDLLDDTSNAPPIIRFLNLVLLEAIQHTASDIHFEPTAQGLHIRFRIDGVLQMRQSPPQDMQAQILTRLKIMARMDIAEHRLPQDGRIKLKMGRREIDFRVSTLPTSYGERIVLRILDKGNLALGLNALGMPEKVLTFFKKMIHLPEGMVLVTGPTGSGKTTTLYSALNDLKDVTTNIMTIEDPVEYQIEGISQIGVHPKIDLTFAAGLRHILRQDPDVIMVGEIRDRETADVACQASLTGHLVLSTLHTNDAPSAVTRLSDMGIEPYLVASSLVGVVAQRLVRKLCPHCALSYTPPKSECLSLFSTPVEGNFKKAVGCEECFFSGYKGRVGLYEILDITPEIQKQMSASPDAHRLRTLATDSLIPLSLHAQKIVLEGISTFAEVLRVVRGV